MGNILIAELDRFLASERPDLYATLQPGTTGDALDKFQATLVAPLPRLFRELYEWRNGQIEDTSEPFWDIWFFHPLEEVRDCKQMLDDMIGYDFDRPDWWGRGWVPFLGNRNGDHVCLDLTAEFKGEPGQLITFWHDWEVRSPGSFDLEWWLRGVIRPHSVEETLERLKLQASRKSKA